MGRVQRKCVLNPVNTTQSNVYQEKGKQSSQKKKKLSIGYKQEDKFTVGKCSFKCQSLHHPEKAVVLLEDIGITSSLVTKRPVLGDKTNRSTMSPSNQKPKNINGSTNLKHQDKLSYHIPERISGERSSYMSDSRKLLSDNNSSLRVVSSEGNLINQAKSSHRSDKCIYTKVQRETLRNKNMPLEEKLAQYEFEVDENEPIVKKRKKRNVTRRKKVKLKEVYCSSSKVFQKIIQSGVVEAEERIKTKPTDCLARLESNIGISGKNNCGEQTCSEIQEETFSPHVPSRSRKCRRTFSGNGEEKIQGESKDGFVANLKSKIDISVTDNCREQAFGYEVQEDALSPLVSTFSRKSSRSFSKNVEGTIKAKAKGGFVANDAFSPLVSPSNKKTSRYISENLSPVARPDNRNKKRNVSRLGDENFEVNANENNVICNLNFCEKSSNMDLDDRVDSCTSNEMHPAENRSNNETDQIKSQSQSRLQFTSLLGKPILTPLGKNVKDTRFSLPEITSTSIPVFQSTPMIRSYKAPTNISHSAGNTSVNYSANLNKRVYNVPRESGGNQCNNVLTENWSVDNCFGFDEGSEEPVELSSFGDNSPKLRLRNITPAISCTPFFNKRKSRHLKGKENAIPSHSKRKHESSTSVLTNKSPTVSTRNENTSSVMNKSNASVNTTEEHSGSKLGTSDIETLSSPVISNVLPYSNPLKQLKLNFLAATSDTSTCKTPKEDKESPLLFKDPEDQTPFHFKEPPRRSYVRSVRRKMRPIGCEWIETDCESEEEGEHSHSSARIKRKRTKLNKHEEKEANKWMKDFNRQCEEIEDFELCVEK